MDPSDLQVAPFPRPLAVTASDQASDGAPNNSQSRLQTLYTMQVSVESIEYTTESIPHGNVQQAVRAATEARRNYLQAT